MGKLEFIEPKSEEYAAFMKYRKIGPNAFSKMPYPMPMMRVVPVSADYFDSTLGKPGYFMRQHFDFS